MNEPELECRVDLDNSITVPNPTRRDEDLSCEGPGESNTGMGSEHSTDQGSG